MNGTRWMKGAAALACGLAWMALGSGCHSVSQEHYRAGLQTEILPAKFKPVVEPMRGAPIAKGESKSFTVLWILPLQWPEKFSHDPNAFYGDWLKDAAVYDACAKSGADILLAPRFSEERVSGPLWFFRKRNVSVEGIPAKIVGAQEIPVEKWPLLFGPNSGTQVIKTVD